MSCKHDGTKREQSQLFFESLILSFLQSYGKSFLTGNRNKHRHTHLLLEIRANAIFGLSFLYVLTHILLSIRTSYCPNIVGLLLMLLTFTYLFDFGKFFRHFFDAYPSSNPPGGVLWFFLSSTERKQSP
ncbi:hypothetical protein A7K93_10465 [Candidatus Methylacidiphilum fumarolicum]|nr:hypothetical protein A7K73_09570 [Candidatus Methylacidiphilum fumarolicum]TFE71659.1 hypothetical protein A7K93_10465 [Candidatus Methylacidiphilum fumarolicum]TFE72476.1 hypothetical protein A7K72_08630 [Candidatus Methylacidiphilum fumarolicum]TFE75415.1 hypothetical protein A7D33_10955 [Candidatus Methylacidiphilum fumarolicum]